MKIHRVNNRQLRCIFSFFLSVNQYQLRCNLSLILKGKSILKDVSNTAISKAGAIQLESSDLIDNHVVISQPEPHENPYTIASAIETTSTNNT